MSSDLRGLRPSEKRAQQFRKLTEVSRALTYAVSLDEVLNLAVRRAAELLESQRAILMLTNTDGLLSVRAAFGLDPSVKDAFREPLDETLVYRLQRLLDVKPECFLGVPLVVSGVVTGILAVALQRESGSEEDEWLLSALADQAAMALEKTRLDEAAKFRERVIGIVSHDLRGPIQAIVFGAAALLMRELDPQDTTTVVRMKQSAERAGRMIRDLLDYTQAHLGSGIPIERRPANVYAIIRQVVEEVQAAHSERHIEVRESGSGLGHYDIDRLAQVVSNLLSNALAYSPPDTKITIEGRDDGGHVSVSINNRGEPIPRERLARIFEPMQRAVTAPAAASRSVGLGLYIVRHVVDAHGGTVSVESNAEHGTTFTFSLPRDAS